MEFPEFFAKFANLPFKKRTKAVIKIFEKITKVEGELRPLRIEQKRLLKKAEDLIK